jgi:hypothetical protein
MITEQGLGALSQLEYYLRVWRSENRHGPSVALGQKNALAVRSETGKFRLPAGNIDRFDAGENLEIGEILGLEQLGLGLIFTGNPEGGNRSAVDGVGGKLA